MGVHASTISSVATIKCWRKICFFISMRKREYAYGPNLYRRDSLLLASLSFPPVDLSRLLAGISQVLFPANGYSGRSAYRHLHYVPSMIAFLKRRSIPRNECRRYRRNNPPSRSPLRPSRLVRLTCFFRSNPLSLPQPPISPF